MSITYQQTTASLYAIMDWIYMRASDGLELRIGIWDDAECTYYATIEKMDHGVLYGESTYGSETILEALTDLEKELPSS